ncbi:bacillithiol system redox-active protein YtxJ [uncultured Planktosalinus sp.]|uniref:bacillithiol system redox-active protein YtxJ n=1 Tax=uncultured Planktosalinus sp. TaxID=1810935 RepID=UPI0030D72FD0
MSFLNKIFSSDKIPQEPKREIPWKQLTSVSKLDEIIETSKTKPVAIFKHSTRCGISRMVLKQFERDYNAGEEVVDLYYLDLLSYRFVSDEVAARFQVWHQSPQLLIIQNGKCVNHASHSEISSIQF